MSGKEAVVLVVDTRPGMFKTDGNKWQERPIDRAIGHLRVKVLQRIMDDRSTDLMGLVLLGTEETENALFDEENYGHITVVSDLAATSLATEKRLCDIKEGVEADLLDALVVAADLLMNGTEKKKFALKQIVLASNLASSPNTQGLDDILERFKDAELNLECLLLETNETRDEAKEILGRFPYFEAIDGWTTTIPRLRAKRVRPTAVFRGA